MGLLAVGTPLPWPEAKKRADQVRAWGIEQLLAIWGRAKGKERDALLWGDEIEYLVVCFDDPSSRVRLSLRQADILAALASDEKLLKLGGGVPDLEAVGNDKSGVTAPTFHPEFGRFMLEATPGKPWGIGFKDLLDVEHNMKWRRKIARDHMAPTEQPLTLTTFPLLGLGDTTVPVYPNSGERLRSQFLPDEIANPHIRFPTLAANIRARRGRKVEINVPIFRDEKMSIPFRDPTVDYDLHKWPEDNDVRNGAAKDNHVYMDAMAFGMGSCCLQITFQAKNIDEGRKMYDQLSPLGPILLALTAATPIYKGFLVDTDVRWNQISRAVDDRTLEELGEAPLKHDRFRMPKSRYASNSTYIAQDSRLRPEYQDPNLVVDEAVKHRLMQGGMDELLATHFAHLFIRDPINVFAEDLNTLDLSKADHFENLQSTNWQHMRFKPPPADGVAEVGWRVEFRPMEIQMTDFENAAFSVFIVLVTRAILSFDLNLYIPIARTAENMETAHERDAVLKSKFWFRKQPFASPVATAPAPSSDGRVRMSNGDGVNSLSSSSGSTNVDDEYELMTVDEIINGQQSSATASTTAFQRSNGIALSPSASAPLHNSNTTSDHADPNHNSDTTSSAPNTESTNTTTTASSTPFTSDPSSQPSSYSPFPGLIPLVESYLDGVNVDVDTRCRLASYLDLIRARANGRASTGARWIRNFVASHPDYRKDSVVGPEIVYDLCKAVQGMSEPGGVGSEEGRRKTSKAPGRDMFPR